MKQPLTLIAILVAGVLTVPALAPGAPVLSTIVNADCNGPHVVRDEALAVSEQRCEVMFNGHPIQTRASARASANPLGSFRDVSGVADTDFGAAAEFQADSSDLVTLHPPQGSRSGPVTVQAGTTYDVGIVRSGSLQIATGSVRIEVPEIDGAALFFPPNARHEEDRAGRFSGSILTDPFTILSCPCDIVVHITARGFALNGGFVEVTDPFFLQLPPGWTYTLSSAPSDVAEPGTLISIALGIALLCMWRRGRLRDPNGTAAAAGA
jgi:hypothetical protein